MYYITNITLLGNLEINDSKMLKFDIALIDSKMLKFDIALIDSARLEKWVS